MIKYLRACQLHLKSSDLNSVLAERGRPMVSYAKLALQSYEQMEEVERTQ
jgi:hypothetical protein